MKRYANPRSLLITLKSSYWRLKFKLQPCMKRALDVMASLSLALLVSPLLIVVAVLIKLDKGPIFYRQKRVGLNGAVFEMWKFRSMVVDADQVRDELESENEMQNGVIFKMKRDPRITRVGRVIRKLSIDELPQLINILRGEMSLVGPRPPIPAEVAQYTRSDRRRLAVLPGLTCFWQVNGRSDIPFDRQVELDVKYIESQSLWLDLRLMLKTIPAVLAAKGAY